MSRHSNKRKRKIKILTGSIADPITDRKSKRVHFLTNPHRDGCFFPSRRFVKRYCGIKGYAIHAGFDPVGKYKKHIHF